MKSKTLTISSGFAATEQSFNAGAGFNECFFFVPGQVLDFVLNFQSPPFFSDLFLKNQLQRTPSPQVFSPFICPVIGEPAFNISGNAGVQTPVAASHHIQVPVRHRIA
jgi:hypothetical protein